MKPLRGVLVTGVDAPVGEWLVRALLEDTSVGHVVAVAPRPERVALPQSARLTCLPVELQKERHVHDLLFGPVRELGVEVIIHTATAGPAYEIGGVSRVMKENTGSPAAVNQGGTNATTPDTCRVVLFPPVVRSVTKARLSKPLPRK